MNPFVLLFVGVLAMLVGSILGYLARQSIAKKQIGTVEERLQKKISQAQNEAELILAEARKAASKTLGEASKEESERRGELLETERLLLSLLID